MRKDLRRLISIIKKLAKKPPIHLWRFVRCRDRKDLLAIAEHMGIHEDRNPRRRVAASLEIPLDHHAVLLWATWPDEYADRPKPKASKEVFEVWDDLVAMRARRFLDGFGLWAPKEDDIRVERPPPDLRNWNFLVSQDRTFRKPKRVAIDEPNDGQSCMYIRESR